MTDYETRHKELSDPDVSLRTHLNRFARGRLQSTTSLVTLLLIQDIRRFLSLSSLLLSIPSLTTLSFFLLQDVQRFHPLSSLPLFNASLTTLFIRIQIVLIERGPIESMTNIATLLFLL